MPWIMSRRDVCHYQIKSLRYYLGKLNSYAWMSSFVCCMIILLNFLMHGWLCTSGVWPIELWTLACGRWVVSAFIVIFTLTGIFCMALSRGYVHFQGRFCPFYSMIVSTKAYSPRGKGAWHYICLCVLWVLTFNFEYACMLLIAFHIFKW